MEFGATKPSTPPSAFSGLGIGMVHGWVGSTGGISTFTPRCEVREQTALPGLLLTAWT